MVNIWPPLARPEPRGSGRALTADEWAALPEDKGGELAGGELVEEEVPDAVHELAVTWLVHILRTWLGQRGFVLSSELKLRIAPDTGRKPDLSVYLPDGVVPPKYGAMTAPPDIVIEIITATPRDERRDRVEKMADYAVFGVRFYWLLDPALGTFEVFARDDAGNYVKVVGQSQGAVVSVPGCPGLRIDLDALWSELERLADD